MLYTEIDSYCFNCMLNVQQHLAYNLILHYSIYNAKFQNMVIILLVYKAKLSHSKILISNQKSGDFNSNHENVIIMQLY